MIQVTAKLAVDRSNFPQERRGHVNQIAKSMAMAAELVCRKPAVVVRGLEFALKKLKSDLVLLAKVRNF